MRPGTNRKSFIIGIFFSLLVLSAGNGSSKVEPNYGGWTVSGSWEGYGTILRATDSGNTWIRQGAGQIPDVNLSGVFAVDPYTAWVVGSRDNGYGAIYHTTDGGKTWGRKGSSNIASPDYVPDVEFLKVHASGDDVWIVGRDTGTILHTSDNGETWTNHTPEAYKDIELQGVFAVDQNTVWASAPSVRRKHGLRTSILPDTLPIRPMVAPPG